VNSAWKKNLSDPQVKDFEAIVKSVDCRSLIEQYITILETDIDATVKEMVTADYSGDWALNQSRLVAEVKTLRRMLTLFKSLLTSKK